MREKWAAAKNEVLALTISIYATTSFIEAGISEATSGRILTALQYGAESLGPLGISFVVLRELLKRTSDIKNKSAPQP